MNKLLTFTINQDLSIDIYDKSVIIITVKQFTTIKKTLEVMKMLKTNWLNYLLIAALTAALVLGVVYFENICAAITKLFLF